MNKPNSSAPPPVYVVVSRNADGSEHVEARRSDRAAAQADAQLIKSVTGRPAYVEERTR